MARVSYNERSWAIDLIGYLRTIAHSKHRPVRHVSGEQTIAADGGNLFPDILLFGDRDAARILQGWELKFPDTPIDDAKFFDNAEEKARYLGLDSFVLWNVRYARLYKLNHIDNIFVLHTEWDQLHDITSRSEVSRHRTRWEAVGADILRRVNDLLASDDLEGRGFIESYRSGGLTELVLQNARSVADAIEDEAKKSRDLRSQIDLWWNRSERDYNRSKRDYNDKKHLLVLARTNLINWMGKFLFAHVLREHDDRAAIVTQIDEATGPVNALAKFDCITRECNFWTVFCNALALCIVPKESWRHLCEFNRLLGDLRIGAIDQAQISSLLEASVAVSDRKIKGQYTTPSSLANLLVKICIDDLNDRILDPCCGSGTILRSALDIKLKGGIPPTDAADQLCGNDLDTPAVQLATFSLASPLLMQQPLRIFPYDAFTLKPDLEVSYRNPSDGTEHTETLGKFRAITTNLPFVSHSQEGRKTYSDAIQAVNAILTKTGDPLPKKADVAAYLPFALYDLLEPGGRMGIIMTNAWLGTDWGEVFYERLKEFFELRIVITSGAGRWFSNSKVVTNILILEKPVDGVKKNHPTDFVVLKQPLEVLDDDEHSNNIAAMIDLGIPQDDALTIHRSTRLDIARLRPLGLAVSAPFVDMNWALDLPMVPVRELLDIRRGERRGWNPFFYPDPEHGIEPEYIRPVLRSSSDIERLITSASKEAFSCSRTIAEMEKREDLGALAWIRHFEKERNRKNKRLPDVLARSAPTGGYWYELKADRLAELVIPINPGSRLYVGRVDPPAFVDQRLIALNAKPGVDADLVHLLMNSAIGLSMIEAIGFGRGKSALDLNKSRIEKSLHVLDPARIDDAGKERIMEAFQPVARRRIFDIADELDRSDRIAFDDTILEVFDISVERERIYDNLRALFEIRNAATG